MRILSKVEKWHPHYFGGIVAHASSASDTVSVTEKLLNTAKRVNYKVFS